MTNGLNANQLIEIGRPAADLPDNMRLSNFPHVAAISIRAGLRAYFTSYKFAGISDPIDPNIQRADEYRFFQVENSPGYLELYISTIVFLHHGIELALKELLRQKHPLLASAELPDSAVILLHVLNNQPLDLDTAEKLKSTEFGNALRRLITLQKKKLLDRDLILIVQNELLLQSLNKLRNRIIHRGLFVMDYSAFDLFLFGHLVPFLKKLLLLPQFENKSNQGIFSETKPKWKYKPLACGVDPIDEISRVTDATLSVRAKVAFLKELGRAAYENPLAGGGGVLESLMVIDDSMERASAENIAKFEKSNPHTHALQGANTVLNCPVCGAQALVRYNDGDGNDTEVICTCCTFKAPRSLGNGSEHGLTIESFWS